MGKMVKTKKEENRLLNIDYNSHEEIDLVVYKLLKERESFREPLETYNRCMDSKETFSLAKTAKILDYPNIGRNNLCEFLRDHKIFRKGYGNNEKDNEPYQKYIKEKWFTVTMVPYKVKNIDKTYAKIEVTAKGLDKIREMFDDYFNE